MISKRRYLSYMIMTLCVLLMAACSNGASSQDDEGTLADWGSVTFEQMMNGESDLVVLAKVSSIKSTTGADGEYDVQLAELDVKDVFYGEPAEEDITLYQSTDKVQEGSTYLLFLTHRPVSSVYVVSSHLSQTHISDTDQLEVKVLGIEGTYKNEELHRVFEPYLK